MASSIAIFFFYRLDVSGVSFMELRVTSLPFLMFFGESVAIFFQLLSSVLHPHVVPYVMPWVSPFTMMASASSVMFSFYFLKSKKQVSRLELILVLVFSGLICFEFYIAISRVIVFYTGVVEYRETWAGFPFSLVFVLSLFFYMKHLASAMPNSQRKCMMRSYQSAVLAVIWPLTALPKDASRIRMFFYVFLLPVLIAVVLLLRSYGFIGWVYAEILGCILILLTFTSFSVVYLNYVPETSSLKVKMIGISMVTVLSVFCGISWIVGNTYVESYQFDGMSDDKMAIRFEPENANQYRVLEATSRFDDDIGELVEGAGLKVDLPFKFPFYEDSYEEIFLHQSGMVGFESFPVWRDVRYGFGPQPAIFLLAIPLLRGGEKGVDSHYRKSGVYVNHSVDTVVVTWLRMASKSHSSDLYTFQLILHSQGSIEFLYKDAPDSPVIDIDHANIAPLMKGIVPGFSDRQVEVFESFETTPYVSKVGQGVVEYQYLYFLRYLNTIYMPVAYFIMGSIFLIVIVFPRFFYVNLDQPLSELISGVRDILGGKLDASINVIYRDEIGYLAASFNEMAKQQSALIYDLEDKVTERTEEASEYAVKNARLEERNHLSRELHDAVSQTLFAANLIVDTLPDLIDKDKAYALSAAEDIRMLNKEALLEMRKLLIELRENKTESVSFGDQLHRCAEKISSRYNIQIKIHIESDHQLPEVVQKNFLRVAQESLTNSAKHAQASLTQVYFDCTQDQALLKIEDDGRGFKLSDVQVSSLGMKIMRERIEDLGGSFEIESQLGKGTITTAIWFGDDAE